MALVDSLPEAFVHVAADLDRERERCTKPKHLWVNVVRAAVQCGRLVFEALDHGLLGQLTGLREFAGIFTERESDGAARCFWTFAVISTLARDRPSRIKPNAVAFDYPPVKTNAKNKALGRNGKVLRRRRYTNPKTGRRGSKLQGEIASVIDDYDEADTLAHLRVQANNYADACRTLAELAREDTALQQAAREAKLNATERKIIVALGELGAFGARRYKKEDAATAVGAPPDSTLIGTSLAGLKKRGILNNTYRCDGKAGYFLTELGREIFLMVTSSQSMVMSD